MDSFDEVLDGLDNFEEEAPTPQPGWPKTAGTTTITTQPVYQSPAPQSKELDLKDVESRLEVAQYYQLLLSDSLFSDDDSPPAQKVESEIREFIKTRLKALVGLASETPNQGGQFTSDEVRVLKLVASRLMPKTQKRTVPQRQEPEPTPPPPEPVEPKLNKFKRAKKTAPPPPKVEQTQPQPTNSDPPGTRRVGDRLYKRVEGPNGGFDLDVTPQAQPPPGTPKHAIPLGHQATAITSMQSASQAQNYSQAIDSLIKHFT